MKIVFMGTPSFAVPSLEMLIENKYNVCSVVTAPDMKKGRGLNVSISEVKECSLKYNLKILQPENLKDEKFISEISEFSPDLIIVVAFRILPKEVYSIPALGSFNLHASLLPAYRGAAPINHAVINGEKETGVTTFFLKEKVDTGNILLQKKVNIDINDDAGSLHDKLSLIGAECVLETVKLIESGSFIPFEQNELLSSPAPKIFKKDCKIDWNKDSVKIHNLVRGLSPYPSAYSILENRSVKIFKTKFSDLPASNSPGTVIIKDKKMLVSTGDNILEIEELQFEGKKRISAIDFINSSDKSKEYKFS
ncbi:MAG TPA: methionyl-tRNA formyltransferase [Ignavibacteria bacterium]|nr:methionyl-tRNA formyltransferase [Ignavibacteria bacterium]